MITPEMLEEVKKRLVDTYNPVSIYLFGSYAWGKPTEESDLDIFIVIKDSDEPKRYRRPLAGYNALYDLGIANDILVYTVDECTQLAQDKQSLAHHILAQGRKLYGDA